MKTIGAGLEYRIEDGAIATAEFRAVSVSLDFEFLNYIDRGLNDVRLAGENIPQI
jgi:hypothetical protein